MQSINLSLEETAAQCIFPRLDIPKYLSDLSYQSKINGLVNRGIGGFCIFGGNKYSASRTIGMLQDLSALPLLFCADFEHGLAMRLSDGTSFPQAMALGQTDSETVYQTSKKIANEAKSIGIMWNLAPVCDINSNSKNPIINIRSFGEDAESVSMFCNAYIKGTQDEGILSCAKHFPGHGDTEVDTHLGSAILKNSLQSLNKTELIPFKNAINTEVSSIMLGHLAVPAIDSEGIPCSVSEKTVDFLRNELGFKELIVTDALDMKAITNSYNSAEATIKAISAGTNVALMPEDPVLALDGLIAAAKGNPTIAQKLIDSAEMIIQKKKWCALFNRRIPATSETSIDENENEQFAFITASKAIELKDPKSILPIKDNQQIAAFAVLQDEEIEPASFFFKLLAQVMENDVDFGFIDSSINTEHLESLKTGISGADLIIFALFYRAKAYSGSIETDERINTIIKELSEGKQSVAVLLGNPYLLDKITCDAYLRTFSNTTPSIAASVLRLAGRDVL